MSTTTATVTEPVATVPNVETPNHAPTMVQAHSIVFEAVTTAAAPLRADIHAIKATGKSTIEARAIARRNIGADVLSVAVITGKGVKAAALAEVANRDVALLAAVRHVAKDTDTQCAMLRARILDSVAAYLPGMKYVLSIRADGVKMAKRADWMAAIEYATTAANATNKAGKPAVGSKDAVAALAVLHKWDATMETMRSA